MADAADSKSAVLWTCRFESDPGYQGVSEHLTAMSDPARHPSQDELSALIGATVEEAGFDKHNTVEGIEDLLAFARRLLPDIGRTRLETVWAGLRPGTPDDLPILGRIPGWPALVATGHYRNGILLAPWTARQVERLALSGHEDEEPAFSPRRFLM